MDRQQIYDLINQKFTDIVKELNIQIIPNRRFDRALKKMDELVDQIDSELTRTRR